MFRTKTHKSGYYFFSVLRSFFEAETVHRQSSITHHTSQIKKKPSFFKQKAGALLFASLFLFAAFGPSFGAAGEAIFGYEQTQANTTGGTSETAQKLGELASFLVSILTPIVSAEAGLMAFLMDSGFILGDPSADKADDLKSIKDIGQFLNYIWQIIRDLVNYGFIVVLLVIAFMTVISAGGESVGGSFDVKKILPKFVIAVVAVNFTWFGAKVILDVANVATHIVYSIPMSLPDSEKLLEDAIKRNCENVKQSDEKQCYFITKEIVMKGDGSLSQYNDKKGIQSCSEVKDPDIRAKCDEIIKSLKGEPVFVFNAGIVELYQKKLKSWDELSSGTIPGILAFSILNVQELGLSRGYEKDLFQVTLKGMVALLVMIIIITVFTAMFFLLLERVIILWINIILSPVAVLLWVLKDTPLSVDSDNTVLGLKPFLKSAFLPALMGIPLIFGLLLIIVSKETDLRIDQSGLATQISGVDTIIDGISTLHELFFYIMALGSMWVAMKIAEDSAVFVKPVVEGVSNGVKGVGKFVAKSPLYAPWIPTASTPQNPDGRSSIADLGTPFRRILNDTFWTNYQLKKERGVDNALSKLNGKTLKAIDKLSTGEAAKHLGKLKGRDRPFIEGYLRDEKLNPDSSSNSTDNVLRAIAEQAGQPNALNSELTRTASPTGPSPTTINFNVSRNQLEGKGFSEQVNNIYEVHKVDIQNGRADEVADLAMDTGLVEAGKSKSDLADALRTKSTS